MECPHWHARFITVKRISQATMECHLYGFQTTRLLTLSGTITEVLVSIDFVTSSRKACTSRRYLTTYSVTSSNHCYGSS